MKSLIISSLLYLLLASQLCIAGEYQVITEESKFYTYHALEGQDKIPYKDGKLSLGLVKYIYADGTEMCFVRAIYRGKVPEKKQPHINAGQSLDFIIDGERLELSTTKDVMSRERTLLDKGKFLEEANYPVCPSQIAKIIAGEEILIKLKAEDGDIHGWFMGNMQKYWKKFYHDYLKNSHISAESFEHLDNVLPLPWMGKSFVTSVYLELIENAIEIEKQAAVEKERLTAIEREKKATTERERQAVGLSFFILVTGLAIVFAVAGT